MEKKFYSNYILSHNSRRTYRERLKKTGDNCIFCAAIKDLEKHDLPSFVNGVPVVTKFNQSMLIVNLFPYVPKGHLIIVTKKHIVDYNELNEEEIDEIFKNIIPNVKNCLKKEYPDIAGFSIGINLGKEVGASIEHFHIHIVPRFIPESGFMEATAGTRVLDETPEMTMERIAKYFK